MVKCLDSWINMLENHKGFSINLIQFSGYLACHIASKITRSQASVLINPNTVKLSSIYILGFRMTFVTIIK